MNTYDPAHARSRTVQPMGGNLETGPYFKNVPRTFAKECTASFTTTAHYVCNFCILLSSYYNKPAYSTLRELWLESWISILKWPAQACTSFPLEPAAWSTPASLTSTILLGIQHTVCPLNKKLSGPQNLQDILEKTDARPTGVKAYSLNYGSAVLKIRSINNGTAWKHPIIQEVRSIFLYSESWI